jgi:hypothetical protein
MSRQRINYNITKLEKELNTFQSLEKVADLYNKSKQALSSWLYDNDYEIEITKVYKIKRKAVTNERNKQT